MYTYEDYLKSADYMRGRLPGFIPEILMILGSGLGFMGDEAEDPIYIDYASVPGFKTSTAPGHKGRFVMGRIEGRNVAVMQGRFHCYEGYSMEEVAYPVRVLRLMGASTLIVTNAAGAVNTDFHPGDIMIITDHIRLFGFGPLRGQNIEEFGPRFNDMSAVYDPELIGAAERAAAKEGIDIKKGVYMYFPGPNFETPAEIRAARILGADAVGMSTVPEATVAAHCGMRVLGLSLLSNMAAGIGDIRLSSDDVNATAESSSQTFGSLIRATLNLAPEDSDNDRQQRI